MFPISIICHFLSLSLLHTRSLLPLITNRTSLSQDAVPSEDGIFLIDEYCHVVLCVSGSGYHLQCSSFCLHHVSVREEGHLIGKEVTFGQISMRVITGAGLGSAAG